MPSDSKPKRRNAISTRANILGAAFDLFSQQGYTKTGIREICDVADVSSSLVSRYFGTKANLFEEALIHGIYNNSLFVREKKHFGSQMAQLIAKEGNAKLTAMMVLAIADPESREVTQAVIEKHVLQPLAEWLEPPDARERATQMLTLLHGFTIQSLHLNGKKVHPRSVQWLAKQLQALVDNQ